ncbi:MAG: sigma-70 family RNA polymerase sigma factor, partial [Candidatus Omnitrophica bacterium]|nr:sigma-70 family RNA polymerase sigma factor [Candidatus Omnitrophota bacterium]
MQLLTNHAPEYNSGASTNDESGEPMTDKEWIRQALAEYEGPLLRYVHRMVGDLETARDVVQDAFLKLCSSRPEKVRDHVAPWLYTVCRNRALDIQRKESRMNPISEPMMAVTPSEEP